METEEDKGKHTEARRWVDAVNNWAELGPWRFAVCRDPQTLTQVLAQWKTTHHGA